MLLTDPVVSCTTARAIRTALHGATRGRFLLATGALSRDGEDLLASELSTSFFAPGLVELHADPLPGFSQPLRRVVPGTAERDPRRKEKWMGTSFYVLSHREEREAAVPLTRTTAFHAAEEASTKTLPQDCSTGFDAGFAARFRGRGGSSPY